MPLNEEGFITRVACWESLALLLVAIFSHYSVPKA
jgi:hypothetical protein